ncbi:MAG: amidohydrolase family protein [SAR202 cluster bacterium]|jgi:dihydropyrimidinase|nr:amidohydrolase family protein [SAR202 cluster bacterium]MQG75444.1 amidohydrolase family protein [SAR202 cluster bacterium]|tara:strand:+ start:1509 stop:2945 length:1437 start_codon:yes stop_codon:yes gene_type:complete
MLDLLIHGGTVVTPSGVGQFDIGIQGEKIVLISARNSIIDEANRSIDATGKYVLPGGIEPHTHIATRVSEEWAGRPGVMTQSPEAASRAAAHGGVTTYIDFAGGMEGTEEGDQSDKSIMARLDARRGVFSGHSYTDFAFHFTFAGEVPTRTIEEIGEAVQSGVSSFKIFTTFGSKVPYGHLWAIFEAVGNSGGIMAVHAEDDDMVKYMEAKLIREGRDQGYNLHLAHNNISEDISFRKIIRLSEHTETGIYFVHTTAKEGAYAIADARNKQLPVYGEALHNYLHFTHDHYREPEGTAIHTYPAIKHASDRDGLQDALINGTLSTTATDEYTTYKDIKLSGNTIETVCGGHNGIETRLPVVYTKFVSTGRISIEKFVDITSTNAAKILGMYPQKGAIATGSDADIVLFDPDMNKTITLDGLHADSDYSIWEGFECQGYPVMTILRGKIIVENGELKGSPSDGNWLARKVAASVLANPEC